MRRLRPASQVLTASHSGKRMFPRVGLILTMHYTASLLSVTARSPRACFHIHYPCQILSHTQNLPCFLKMDILYFSDVEFSMSFEIFLNYIFSCCIFLIFLEVMSILFCIFVHFLTCFLAMNLSDDVSISSYTHKHLIF